MTWNKKDEDPFRGLETPEAFTKDPGPIITAKRMMNTHDVQSVVSARGVSKAIQRMHAQRPFFV